MEQRSRIWDMSSCRDGRYLQVLANLEQPCVQVVRLFAAVGLRLLNLYLDSHPLQLDFWSRPSRQELWGEIHEFLRLSS